MSDWNHSLCDSCWYWHRPDQAPARIVDPEVEVCCLCGISHFSGIYVRRDPNLMPCRFFPFPTTHN